MPEHYLLVHKCKVEVWLMLSDLPHKANVRLLVGLANDPMRRRLKLSFQVVKVFA